MGMFDYIKIPEDKLPVEAKGFDTWQIKDFACQMEDYTIEADGTLTHHLTKTEVVPENERPYWGKPEWAQKPIYQAFGMLRTLPDKDVTLTDFHGDLFAIGSRTPMEFRSLRIRFTHGKLEEIIVLAED